MVENTNLIIYNADPNFSKMISVQCILNTMENGG